MAWEEPWESTIEQPWYTNDEWSDPGSYVPPTYLPPESTGMEPQGSSFWTNLLKGLGSGLMGTVAPAASLLGNLASGGKGPTQTDNSNRTGFDNRTGFENRSLVESGNRSETRLENQTKTGSHTGFNNQNLQATLDPQGQAAMDRLTAMMSGNASGAQGAYDQGLSMLKAMATNSMNPNSGTTRSLPGAPNTTASPAAVTGFPTELPTSYNASLGNLIKQAFGSFTGDIASSAITNARSRGFAGGTDLLGSAAAPIAGPALARMPAEMAKAYLDHVLQAYTAQGNVASQKAGAEAGALNAATNALGPGVQKYGIDASMYNAGLNADNQKINNQIGLMNALMAPQDRLMAGNLGLLNAAPRGQTSRTLSGGTDTSNLSGVTTANSQTNNTSLSQGTSGQNTNTGSQGTNTGNSQTPLGPTIAQGIANIFKGFNAGQADTEDQAAKAKQQQSILAFLKSMGIGVG